MVSYPTSMKKLKCLWFIGLVLICGVFSVAVFASPKSIDQAKRTKIDTTIRIIQEQIKRGLYPAAQAQLHNLQTSEEFSSYISEPQNQTILQLQAKVQRAVAERETITRVLQQSDLLESQGEYLESLKLLRQIKDSPFTTEQEKQMILASYQEIERQVDLQQQGWQTLFDSSVNAYNNGQMDEARQGFVQVIESGYTVRGVKTPSQYVSMIDSRTAAQATMPTTREVPVIEELDPVMVVPQGQTMSQSAAANTDIEPMELLELETNRLAADSASAKAGQDERSYLEVIKREQAVRVDYTRAIVSRAIEEAQQSLDDQQFDQARRSLRKAFSTIENNKMLLGDIYGEYNAQLTNLEQKVGEAQMAADQQAREAQTIAADKLTADIRDTMKQQRERAVEDCMERALAFQREQRYEEALGQLEQLLAIDPLNQQALAQRQTLEHMVNFIEQRNIQSEIDRQEIESMLGVQRLSIPHSGEINYPRNWKEIAERREAALKNAETPADLAVNEQLDQTVDLSLLSVDTTLEEAISILQNSSTPPLRNVIVYWKDLAENGYIEKDTPINLGGEGLTNVVLRTGLQSVLDAVSAGGYYAELGFVVREGTVTIATRETLPANYITDIYDVSDLLNPPANFESNNNNQNGGGMGGGMSGGSMGSMGSGMMGGGMMGGMSGGSMGGMSGGSMGGMSGGSMGGGQNSVGNWQQMYKAYQLINTIQQTIEPDSWYETGEGDGTIDQYGESKLIIYQTPEVHLQIKELLDKLREGLGQQISIESRFLLVTENFLEDIGLDTNIPLLKLGGGFGGGATPGSITIEQDSASHVIPTDTGVAGSLGGAFTNPAFGTTLTYESLDDLQVQFILRATQSHGNAKQLQAPKATVLNGETATLQVTTAKRLKTGSTFNTETVSSGNGVQNTVYWWENDNEDINTGIMLTIGPVITADKKYVILRVQTSLTDLIAQDTETAVGFSPTGEEIRDNYTNPTTQTSQIQTRVTVPDRGTAMLGGLTITASREIESGAPILSKMPVLGRFFSNRSLVDDKLMLLILVKPTIILQEEAEEDAFGALASRR